jgi:hypothetical protein
VVWRTPSHPGSNEKKPTSRCGEPGVGGGGGEVADER